MSSLPKLEKFQILAPDVWITGVMVNEPGQDLDIQLDSCFWRLARCFRVYGGVIHCESGEGAAGLPVDPSPLPFWPAQGQRVGLRGALALDNYVHPGEDEGPIVQRFLYRAMKPKLELHPARWGSLVADPPPPTLHSVPITYFEEFYSPDWWWNKVWRKAWLPTAPAVTVTVEVGA